MNVITHIAVQHAIIRLLAAIAILASGPSETLADRFADQRRQMVDQQIRARGITDARVLAAMASVPRHLFVPPHLWDVAYRDTPLPIGHDQTISQPYIVALMSQSLAVHPGDRVLEIGTGSGYQAAVLAQMGLSVFSIEIVPQLGRQAKTSLQPLGYDGIHLKIGDGYQGWPEHAPFEAIIVTCAPTRVPEPLKAQLAEGGRMVIPVGKRHFQQLVLLTKKRGRIEQEKIVDVRFVPMVDERGRVY